MSVDLNVFLFFFKPVVVHVWIVRNETVYYMSKCVPELLDECASICWVARAAFI